MRITAKRIEWLLNGICLVAGALAVFVMVNRLLFPAKRDNNISHGPKRGVELALNGVDWSARSRTLVMALSVNCPYCSESASFYRRVVHSVSFTPKTGVIAVFREPSIEGRAYLAEQNIDVTNVYSKRLSQLGVTGTPTLILVDNDGHVKASWVGFLSPEKEREVLASLGTTETGAEDFENKTQVEPKGGRPGFTKVTAKEVQVLLQTERVLPVVDIRPRPDFSIGHIAGSINIPIDELEYRATHELPRWPPIVVYCYYCPSCDAAHSPSGVESSCATAAMILRNLGFSELRLLSEDMTQVSKSGLKVVAGNKPS